MKRPSSTASYDHWKVGNGDAQLQKVNETAVDAYASVDQIGSQRLTEVPTTPQPITARKARAAFDSDIDGALLQAFSVMQLMHTAANEDNGLDDASSALQLVGDLVWKVHGYVVANFGSLPG